MKYCSYEACRDHPHFSDFGRDIQCFEGCDREDGEGACNMQGYTWVRALPEVPTVSLIQWKSFIVNRLLVPYMRTFIEIEISDRWE